MINNRFIEDIFFQTDGSGWRTFTDSPFRSSVVGATFPCMAVPRANLRLFGILMCVRSISTVYDNKRYLSHFI